MSTYQPSRRMQSLTVIVAVLLFVVTWLALATQTSASAASAPCGPGDANRAALKTVHGERALRPCLSKVNLKLSIPQDGLRSRFNVKEIRRAGQETVKFADGSTEKLWHLSFASFKVLDGATIRTTDNNDAQVSITPDKEASFGGAADSGKPIYTDVWVSAATFRINLLLIGCLVPIDVSNPLLALVTVANSAIPNAITLGGCAIDMDIRYLVSYSDDPSSAGNYPVRLPNTTLSLS
ncbi:hypothetical protein [Flexivirga meconopsidis]|uniref:hypothetical protein n=1 Tax=Flexivirga meconopsidis TaxID=2977121 RepID=UPI00224097A8|nr:hypothetical protein [Flexivirga meconopsidis]